MNSEVSAEVSDKAAVGDVYDSKTFEPTGCIGPLIGRVRVALLEAMDRALMPHNVTAAQYIILSTLVSAKVASASQICRGLSYDAGAMTRMIDRLEQRGLLRRVRVADDRRTQKLELTEEGEALYPKMRASAMSVINGLLRGFTKAEASQLEGFLKRMLENA
jgi:MarR family transcriptional regulator, multiple antibiotic resistance protein MarR